MSQLGRISGQLLKDNLTRNGHDLTFDNDLLHLDVNGRKVGVKTITPQHELDVNGTTRTTDLEVTNQADLADLTISGDTITSNTGILNLANGTGDQVTYQAKLSVDDITIENNVISTNSTNTNLEIRPDLTGPLDEDKGTLDIYANTNVYGNVYVTGNIRADGNITVGDANTDNIEINADVASNIIPNIDNEYTLGNIDYKWKDLWVKNIYAENIDTGDIVVDGITLSLPQGKIYYVAVNGNDTNAGEHQNDPFATLKHALTIANTPGDQIYIYPGEYQEIFPLTVPAGVSIKGAGIRAVKIKPTLATNTESAFLLNGETTVEDLTVADFYAPGYAFKFASGFTVTSRSPYVRNITVLTKGSTITLSDPLGFASADAGGGAYIDGSLANAASKEASMLFHSVTFICPGVDVLVATNGARVEWLNSFTYYANKGMYLLSGSTGFAGDGKTRVKINNRTGTFAAGNTLTYYDTDGTTVLASGTIESVDGNFFVIDGKSAGWETLEDRVGKTISVNGDAKLSTAEKKFGTASLVLDGTGDYLTVASQPDFEFGTNDFTIEFFWRPTALGTPQVLLDMRTATNDTAVYLEMNAAGNIRLFVSNAYRITSSVACAAGSWNHITLFRTSGTTKLAVNGTVTPTTWADSTTYPARPFRFGASWTGGAPSTGYIDELRVVKGVAKYTTSVTVPTAAFLGDTSTVLLLHFNGTNNSTIIVDDGNTFQDIRTDAGGTASIIDVVDYSDFGAEVRSIGSAVVYGNYGIYGDGVGVIAYLIGQNLAYIGNGKETTNDPNTVIQANEVVELNNAKIFYNSVDHKGDFRIGDLFYVNQATGEVSFTNSNVTIGTSLTFDNGSGDITYIDATKIETGDFRISGNIVETLTQDFNIEAASNQVNINSNTTVTGNLDVTGDVTVGGNLIIGNQSTDTVRFVAGVDSDIVPAQDSLYDLGTTNERWATLYTTTLESGGVKVSTNVVESTATNIDLELKANGTGDISVPNNNVQIDQDLTVNGTTDLEDTNITGTLDHTGTFTQTGDYNQTGNTEITGTLTVGSTVQFEDIQISGNLITTTIGNNDLRLEAAGTGRIYVPLDNVEISQTLTVVGTITSTTINNTGTITSDIFSTGDIRIDNNVITTTVGNNNLIIEAAGTGRIYIPNNNVTLGKTINVTGLSTLADVDIVGSVTHTGNTIQVGDVDQTGNYTLIGDLSVSEVAQFKDINITDNVITTTVTNNNLTLQANGTGIISVPSNNVTINQNLTVTGTTNTSNISNTGTVTSGTFSTGNIRILGNTIETTVGNSNLQLQAAGTGFIELESFDIQENEIRINTGTDLIITPNGTGIVNINSNQSLKIPVGATGDRPLVPTAGMIRFNTSLNRYEGYNGTTWIRLDGVEDADGNTYITAELTPGANDNTIRFVTNGVQVADLNSTRFNVINIDVDQININDNIISTTTTNADLIISPNGTGALRIGDFSFRSNIISNTVNNSITYFNQTGEGYVKINSTGGFVIPVGTTEQRPSLFAVGMMRYNTTDQRVEIWDGALWVGAGQGAGGGVSAAEAQDIGIVSAIIFG